MKKLNMHIFFLLFVTLAALTWLYVGLFDSCQHVVVRFLMVAVGVIALFVLPSLKYINFECTDMYIPSGLLELTPLEKGNVLIKFNNVPVGRKIIYWESGAKGGVAKADQSGNAFISLRCDKSAPVDRFGNDKKIPNFLFYRYELPEKDGFFSRIEKINLI